MRNEENDMVLTVNDTESMMNLAEMMDAVKETIQSIPLWRKYTLTIEEAASYFRVGESKLRKLVSENKDADWLLYNGNRPQIKRRLFEKYIDECSCI